MSAVFLRHGDTGPGVTEVADTFTWVTGRHTVKAGADLRWARLDVVSRWLVATRSAGSPWVPTVRSSRPSC